MSTPEVILLLLMSVFLNILSCSSSLQKTLAKQTSILKNLNDLRPLACSHGIKLFALRATENYDFVSACRFTTHIESEISD